MRKDELARLVNGTADPAFVVNGQGVVTAWNEPAHRLFGVAAEHAVGRRCASIVQGQDECGAVCTDNCAVRQAAGRRQPHANFDLQVRTAGGTQWCNVSVLLAETEGAQAPHVIHIMRPVDMSKRLEILVRNFVVANTDLPAPEATALMASGRAAARETALSRREREILGLLARGGTTRSVADHLDLSATTVNNHVQHVLRKLQAHTRLEAIHRAERAGLI